MDRRCAGLPYVGTREPTQEEDVQLSRRFEKFSSRQRVFLVLSISALIVWPASVVLAVKLNRVEFLLVTLGDMVLLPVLALKWRDWRKRASIAAEAASDTLVEIYEGEADISMLFEPELKALLKKGLVAGPVVQRLERLSPSAVVLSVNGTAVESQVRAAASDVVAKAAYELSPFPTKWAPAAMRFNVDNRRVLSTAEASELRRHLSVLRPRYPFLVTLLPLYFLVVGLLRIFSAKPRDFDYWCAVFAVAIVVGTFIPAWVTVIARWRSIQKDVEDEFVVIADDPRRTEFFPRSRLIWTQNNRPSLWRRAAGRDVT